VKRTRITTLVVLGVVGAVAGSLGELALAASGHPIVNLPITLAIALAVIGGIVVTLAVPIRRMTRTAGAPRVDPFYATRILMLAKACAVTGSLVAGVGIGVLAYLLTRSVIGVGSVTQAIAAIALALIPRRVLAIGYQLREDDLLFRRGILFQRFVAVPYGRMQLVDINRGPLSRMLGLSELKFVTAAASTGVTIPGLLEADADALRDRLVALAETRRAGL
jgi:membrane protein YdbS with pleckstrin-like domain